MDISFYGKTIKKYSKTFEAWFFKKFQLTENNEWAIKGII